MPTLLHTSRSKGNYIRIALTLAIIKHRNELPLGWSYCFLLVNSINEGIEYYDSYKIMHFSNFTDERNGLG